MKNKLKVKPRILKGKSSNQKMGKSSNMNKASGQHSTRRINQSTKAINVISVEVI